MIIFLLAVATYQAAHGPTLPAASSMSPEQLSSPSSSSDAQACEASKVPLLVISMDHKRLDGFVPAATKARPKSAQSICRIPGVVGNALPCAPGVVPEALVQNATWSTVCRRSNNNEPSVTPQLTMGAVGLILAHAHAWIRMLDAGLPCAIIAEDDVQVYADSFVAFLERACEAVRTRQLQLVQLQSDGPRRKTGAPGDGADQSGRWVKPSPQESALSAAALLARRDAGPTNLLINTTAYNMGMYLLSREGARKALAHSFPLNFQLDLPEGTLRSCLDSGMFAPPVAQALELGSDTQFRPGSGQVKSAKTGPVEDCSGVVGDVDLLARLESAHLAAARAVGSTERRCEFDYRQWKDDKDGHTLPE